MIVLCETPDLITSGDAYLCPVIAFVEASVGIVVAPLVVGAIAVLACRNSILGNGNDS